MTEHKESSVLARFASPLLILATIIWGSSFVVMKSSVDVLPTFWLLAIRFSFAALVLAVVFIRGIGLRPVHLGLDQNFVVHRFPFLFSSSS